MSPPWVMLISLPHPDCIEDKTKKKKVKRIKDLIQPVNLPQVCFITIQKGKKYWKMWVIVQVGNCPYLILIDTSSV